MTDSSGEVARTAEATQAEPLVQAAPSGAVQAAQAAPRAFVFSAVRPWGDGRGVGYWAFWLNRASGLVLTVYLLVHLGFLSALYRGPRAYDAFLSVVSGRSMVYLDVLLVAAVIYHGFNGVRLSLLGAGLAVQRQAGWFWTAFVLGLVALGYMAWRLLAGG